MISKKSNTQEITLNFDVFSDYNNMVQNENFISYTKLYASVLLNANLSFESQVYKDFYKLVSEAVQNKLPILFNKFNVIFAINPKFSTAIATPRLVNDDELKEILTEDMNVLNLKESKEPFVKSINAEIIDSVLLKNAIVEFLPNMILYKSKNTDNLKLLFNQNLTK